MRKGSGLRISFIQSLILGFVVAAGVVTLLSSGGTANNPTSTTICTFPHQYVRTGSMVRLDGRCGEFIEATDDNAYMQYSWELSSKPADSTVVFSSNYLQVAFVPDVDGDYELTFQTGSGSQIQPGDEPLTTIHITATTGNARPMAEAGPYQEVATGDTVQLHGSGTDADDDSLSYAWQFQPDSASSSLASSTSASPTFVANSTGDYTLDLTVNDAAVNSQANAVLIRVRDINQSRPVAVAGPDQVVTPGSQVQLDGSSSYSAYGRPLSYHWHIMSKPDYSQASLSDKTAAQPSFIADSAGDYLVRLVVNDGINNNIRSLDDVYQDRLIVHVTMNRLPIADGGADQSVTTGTTVSLDGSGSSDPENATLSYQWSLIKQPADSTATLAATDTVSTSLTPDRDGDYLVRLVVNDALEDSDPDIVRVSASSLSGGGTALTLLTSLPYAPPSLESPTWIQVDTDATDRMRITSPDDDTTGNFATAIQVTPNGATQADFSSGSGWSIISPASLTIDESATPTFILQRSSDGMYYKFVLDFTSRDEYYNVQIDTLQGLRCGTNPADCP